MTELAIEPQSLQDFQRLKQSKRLLIVHVTNTDPAGAVMNLVRAVNTFTPHRARLITTQMIPAFDFPKDILDQYDGGDELVALLEKADVIHFHKVKDDFSFDLELARGLRTIKLSDFLNGKKVIHHIHGAPHERNFPQETAEAYAATGRLVLAATPDLEEVYRQWYPNVQYFPNCVPIGDVRYLPRATDDPIMGADGTTKKYCVFQSGTHAVLKNMHVIRDVMDKLSKELPVFFLHTTPENIQTQDFALRHKRIAHVVFDHIEGYYGLSSLEAMSMGKPTIAGLSDYTINAICTFFGVGAEDIPWLVCRNADSIEVMIRNLILDEGMRLSYGKLSRKFMEEVWSDAVIANRLANVYQSL